MIAISEENTKPGTTRFRVFAAVVLSGVVILAVLSIIAPFVNAARFSARVEKALEASLGRTVTFEKVYYRLLPVPGFSLEKVTIGEDPRFGLEPFSSMDGLEARLRIDKLLAGQIRFASLRLVGPSLNLVKRSDGAWNVVEFVQRMTAPRRSPLNLIPAVEVTDGRLDFKFGTRKSTFYITDADISVYPERSGHVALTFSGSPARTDRAGTGFGFMRGTLNWLVSPPSSQSNQLQADVTLMPSDLSELTTLIEGHDIGVHGTVSSHAQVTGPLDNLKVTGDLHLQDVHRWDLLPSSGDDWRVPYGGSIDLIAHRLDLRTLPPRSGESVPAALQVKVNDFLAKASWTLMTSLNKAPVEALLPLARRMGIAIPAGAVVTGAMDGTVGYSNAVGLSGEVSIHNAVAQLPDIPPISAAGAEVKILPEGLHLDPAVLQATGGGTLRVGGDYSWNTQHLAAAISVDAVPIQTLKDTARAWFGMPPALAAFSGGNNGAATGELEYDNGLGASIASREAVPPGWSGQFQFSNATLAASGIAVPLKHAQGLVAFNPQNFDLTRFSATLDQLAVQGSYRYSLTAKRQERVHLQLPEADVEQLAAALEPAFREPDLLARLALTKRSIPDWMAARNLEGELDISHFRMNQTDLGPLNTHFVWQGSNVEIAALALRSPNASVDGSGAVDLAARSPAVKFNGTVKGYRWGGGTIDAEGELEGAFAGSGSLRSLHATGQCSGTDLSLSLNEDFEKVSGTFELSFAPGWPKLHLSKVQASQQDEDWSGDALSNSDGQLVFDLGNGDRQLHIVSLMSPALSGPLPVTPAGERLAQK